MKISRFFVEQNEMEKLKFSFLKRVVAVILGPIRFWFVHVLRILNLVSKTNIELIWSECVFEAYSIIYKPSASRIWGNRSVQKLYTKLPWLGSKEIRRHHFEELICRSLEWKGWYSGSRLHESWVARDKREIPRKSCQKRKRLHELSVTSEPRDSRGSRLSRARAVVRGYLVLSRLSYSFRYQDISYIRVPCFSAYEIFWV